MRRTIAVLPLCTSLFSSTSLGTVRCAVCVLLCGVWGVLISIPVVFLLCSVCSRVLSSSTSTIESAGFELYGQSLFKFCVVVVHSLTPCVSINLPKKKVHHDNVFPSSIASCTSNILITLIYCLSSP